MLCIYKGDPLGERCDDDSNERNDRLGKCDRSEGELWLQDSSLFVPDLKRVSLANARLAEIPRILDKAYAHLTHLCLPFNKIEVIPDISMMKTLEFLDLSHNKVSHIEALPTTVQILRCNNNELDKLTFLKGLLALNELWVSSNKLQWTEFVALIGLSTLMTLVKYGNPADEKLKLVEFLASICPTIRSVDGNVLISPNDQFLASTDGRQMINQVRSCLDPEQRKILQALREGGTAGSKNPTQRLETSKMKSTIPVPVEASDFGSDDLIAPSSVSKPKVESSGHGQKPKINKKTALVDDADVGLDSRQASGTSSAGLQVVAPAEVAVLLRFGKNEDSPAAICIYADAEKSGFIRWKSGAVACSIEQGRMLASFQSGSISCMLDKAGNGSVMDTRGRCLLLLSDKGRAKVLSKKGDVIMEYDKLDCVSLDEGQSCVVAPSPTGSDGGKLSVELASPRNKQEQAQKLHRWKSEGMQIDFIPKYWEVILVHNRRFVWLVNDSIC
jgi:hypothetical protein